MERGHRANIHTLQEVAGGHHGIEVHIEDASHLSLNIHNPGNAAKRIISARAEMGISVPFTDQVTCLDAHQPTHTFEEGSVALPGISVGATRRQTATGGSVQGGGRSV